MKKILCFTLALVFVFSSAYASAASGYVYCWNCGTKIAAECNFCPSCGTRQNGAAGVPSYSNGTIDVDGFISAMYRCYSSEALSYPLTARISLEKENSSYPVSYSVIIDGGTKDAMYLGSIGFMSSSYDNGEGGSEKDIDNVKYVFPVTVDSDDNSTAMIVFSLTCAAIMSAMDEEYYSGAFQEATVADEKIEEIFAVDANSLKGFSSNSYEIGDYKYAVTVFGPNNYGQCRYTLEGGPKDKLFGLFYTQEKIREAASKL